MHPRNLWHLPFAVALIVLVTATHAAPGTLTNTVTDDMGTVVKVPAEPQRIVSLSPSNTEILFALGLSGRVAGVTEYCNYPSDALEKPRIGGYSTVSIEKLVALEPDLILASYGNGEELIGNLRMLGYPVVALHPETLDQVLADIRLVGQATGAEANATALIGDLTKRIAAVDIRIGKLQEHPTVAHIIWHDPIYVSGNGTFQDELIRRAGGVNAFSDVEGWKNVGIEEFIKADPDVLIVNRGTGMGGGEEDTIAQFFRNESRFSGVAAIREGRIFLVDPDIVDRAGPRIVDALELFAEDIHPETPEPEMSHARSTSRAQMPGFDASLAIVACAGGVLVVVWRKL